MFDRWKQQFGGVLQIRCSEKFCKGHRKATVTKSLFNEVVGAMLQHYQKRVSDTGVFM